MIIRALDGKKREVVVDECLSLLKTNGKVLLLPTETVYGLICAYNDSAARKRILEMKRRDPAKHFQVLASGLGMLEGVISASPAARKLVEKFCPGPITIIVKSADGFSSVGFRIPDHEFMLELLDAYGRPVSATSANLSGNPPAATLEEALKGLAGKPDLAVDAGRISGGGKASTVVDITGGRPKILRQGPIGEEEIMRCF